MPSAMDVLVDQNTSHYAISGTTGAITAGAATKLIWYCRYTGTGNALVRRVTIDGVIATTAFAVGQVLYQLSMARNFSAENGTPGGTALTITSPQTKLKDSFVPTNMAVVRIATTAALGTPTWNLDLNPIASLNSHSSAGAFSATPIVGSQYLPRDGVMWNSDQMNDFPVALSNNEGLAINVTVPATGVWIAGVSMEWDETPTQIF